MYFSNSIHYFKFNITQDSAVHLLYLKWSVLPCISFIGQGLGPIYLYSTQTNQRALQVKTKKKKENEIK